MKTLLIGGARSGKSALAQRLAAERSLEVSALVTGSYSDPEMSARISAHRRERPSHWRVREELTRLGPALREESAARRLVLVDCLTVWISNCLWPPNRDWTADEEGWKSARSEFLEALRACAGGVIVVSNEVGAGIVPDNPAARLFRDEQGRLNQAVAMVCDEVLLVAAGLTVALKAARGVA